MLGKRCALAACGLAAAIALPASAARAQPADASEGGLRIFREQMRVQLDQQQASAKEMGLDGGGWFTFAFFNFDDAVAERNRTLRQYDLRLWGSYTVYGVHTFYVRGKMSFDDWNPGDNPATGGGDRFNAPALERAWYRYDYNRAVRNRTGQNPPLGFSLEVGRDYYEIGSALVLAMPLDAVQLTVNAGNWEFLGLVGKTITHTPNIDASADVADHMDRCFYGAQVKYKGFDRHEPYAYHLWQRDNTRPWGGDGLQDYSYDSNYLGVGSRGSLWRQNLRYGVEAVFEYGRGAPEGVASGTEPIHAMGLDALLEYIFDVQRHPKVAAEYMFGSGDPDRRLSSTATVGGNQPGTRDTAFNAFGFRDTGLAFAPRVSNLHVWSIGAGFLPLEDIEFFRKMEVGSKAFFYAKDVAGGAISDTLGTDAARWVGWEWDAYVNWRIASDLFWTVRYGAFRPGEAFGDDAACRQFVYTGLTFSF